MLGLDFGSFIKNPKAHEVKEQQKNNLFPFLKNQKWSILFPYNLTYIIFFDYQTFSILIIKIHLSDNQTNTIFQRNNELPTP